jgi:hypothetical protein
MAGIGVISLQIPNSINVTFVELELKSNDASPNTSHTPLVGKTHSGNNLVNVVAILIGVVVVSTNNLEYPNCPSIGIAVLRSYGLSLILL